MQGKSEDSSLHDGRQAVLVDAWSFRPWEAGHVHRKMAAPRARPEISLIVL